MVRSRITLETGLWAYLWRIILIRLIDVWLSDCCGWHLSEGWDCIQQETVNWAQAFPTLCFLTVQGNQFPGALWLSLPPPWCIVTSRFEPGHILSPLSCFCQRLPQPAKYGNRKHNQSTNKLMAPVSTPCSHVSDGELEGPRHKEVAAGTSWYTAGRNVQSYSRTTLEDPWSRLTCAFWYSSFKCKPGRGGHCLSWL